MLLTIACFLAAVWIVLAAVFVGMVLMTREERRREPRYLREARQAAGKR